MVLTVGAVKGWNQGVSYSKKPNKFGVGSLSFENCDVTKGQMEPLWKYKGVEIQKDGESYLHLYSFISIFFSLGM